MNLIKSDRQRKGEMPLYQPIMRKLQSTNGKRAWGGVLKLLYSTLYKLAGVLYCNKISYEAEIGPGLYIGHPIGITVNRDAKIGKNCNIHKGVTIGQENRGKRKGTPTIGDNV